MTDAERNILEKMKNQWHQLECFLASEQFMETPDDAQVFPSITAGELRAAFGRDNPLIEVRQKEKGESRGSR